MMEMAPEERNAIRSFVERLEAFLLTHSDDHLVAVGNWVRRDGDSSARCPVYQVTGGFGSSVAANHLIQTPTWPRPEFCPVSTAINEFIRVYDRKAKSLVETRIEPLKNVRHAIKAGIRHVRRMFEIEEEPTLLEARVPVAV